MPPCDVCIACDLNRIGETRSCINCPEALNSRALYDDILAAVDSILKSSQYAQSGGNGLIIVQDRHVLHDAILCNIADCSIWLSQENYDICLIQYFKRRGRWPHPPDTGPGEVQLLFECERLLSDYLLGGKFRHAIDTADVQMHNASVVLDIGDNSLTDVMAAAMFYVAPLFHMSGGTPSRWARTPDSTRPIAMSNSVAKLLAMAINRSLAPIAQHTIIDRQRGFVRGRSITDKSWRQNPWRSALSSSTRPNLALCCSTSRPPSLLLRIVGSLLFSIPCSSQCS